MIQNPPTTTKSKSSPAVSSGGTSTRGRRNQKACTSCRQVKLRCDSAQRFPSPCSRCQMGDLQCRIDPDFRRTRAKHQLDEVKSQLHDIQKALKTIPANLDSQHATSTSTLPAPTSHQESWRKPAVAAEHIGEEEDAFYDINLNEDILNSSFTLGSSVLTGGTIIILFKQ